MMMDVQPESCLTFWLPKSRKKSISRHLSNVFDICNMFFKKQTVYTALYITNIFHISCMISSETQMLCLLFQEITKDKLN